MEQDSIYEKLNEMLNSSNGKFSILEEQIDVDLQVEFFELMNSASNNRREDKDILEDEKKLYEVDIPDSEKKLILVELSGLDKPEAYRSIEKFIKNGEKNLKSWAVLSLQHCRISLETSLLDQEQVFISTGLGGSGNKLRYFIAGKLKETDEFTDAQKKIIKTEFDHYFKLKDSEIEKYRFLKTYFTITCLIPIQVPITDLVTPIIQEINQYGSFIDKEYLITNVKKLSKKEIESYFKKKEQDTNEQ